MKCRALTLLAAALLLPACLDESAIPSTSGSVAISAPSTSVTSGGPVLYTLTYSGVAAITLNAADVSLLATGTAAGSVAVSTSGPLTRLVTVSAVSGDGTLAISVAAGSAIGQFGLPIPAAGPSTSFTVDTTPPGLSIGAPSTPLARGGPVTFAISYTGATAFSLDAGDVTLNATGTATGTVSVLGVIVTVSGITGDGTLGISLAAGTASDAAGNPAPAAGPSTTFTVDNTPPTLSISAPSSALQGPSPVTYTLTYGGADFVTLADTHVLTFATGTAAADVAVSGSGTSTRTVTLSGFSGNGTLGINVLAASGFDLAGNPALSAGPSTPFAVDTDPPLATILGPVLGAGTATYTVTFAGASTAALDAGDVVLNATGTATGTVSVAGLDVVISSMSGYGTLGVSLLAGTAFDLAGNPAPAAGPSATFPFDDGVSPYITGVTPSEANAGDPISVDGARFGATQGAGQLRVFGLIATVTLWSDTHIEAIVPAGAKTGPVVVDLPIDSTEGLLIVPWIPKNPANLAVCTAGQDQIEPRIVSDGAGGAFMVWVDRRIPGNNDIIAQRVDSSGAPLWAANGIPIASTADHEGKARIVSDGAGGAIIAWSGGATFDLFAQRIDGAGNALWAAGGVNVANESGSQDLEAAAPDGQGGILLTWVYVGGVPGPSWNNIWAQRVSAAGAPLWGPKGAVVGAQGSHSSGPRVVGNGSGGAYVTWMADSTQVRAQRITAKGAPQWGLAGAAVRDAGPRTVFGRMVAEGVDGLIVAWQNYTPDDLSTDIYTQKLDVAGVRQWGANGVALCAAAGFQGPLEAAPDGAGGAIVAWADHRAGGFGAKIYAGRVSGAGAPLWAVDGVQLTSTGSGQQQLQVVADGFGGAIVAFVSFGAGFTANDIFAQRLDAAGTLLWGVDGRPVSEATSHQEAPQLAADLYGGAIFTWQDSRLSTYDVYAQGVSPLGN